MTKEKVPQNPAVFLIELHIASLKPKRHKLHSVKVLWREAGRSIEYNKHPCLYEQPSSLREKGWAVLHRGTQHQAVIQLGKGNIT
jgi:hypothetical protein